MTQNISVQAVRTMTANQLAQLGMSQIAYVRPVMMDGEMAYSIHGADGTPMAVAPDHEMAVAAIEDQDLMQVLVQ
jgi:hypothetical protein